MRKTALLAVLIATVMVVPIAAYAIHSFTDVPDSAFFSNSVTWMKDNGVSVGCNPPANTQYCPNDDTSRGEMAVFLKRLSENKIVDAATAVNADNATNAINATNADDADKLDGKDPTNYETIVFGTTDETSQGTTGFFAGGSAVHNPILTASFTAPSSGFVQLTYFASVVRSGLDMAYAVSISTDDPTCAFPDFPTTTWTPGSVISTASWDAASGTVVIPATAGAHSYTLCGNGSTGAGDVGLVSAGVSGIFSTVGSTNATTTAVDTGGFGE